MKRKHPGRQRRLDESKIEMRKMTAVKLLSEDTRTPQEKFRDAWNADPINKQGLAEWEAEHDS